MFQNLELFRTAFGMAQHAGRQQALAARNIANADTPGYQADTIARFQDVVRRGTGLSVRTTRTGHIASQSSFHQAQPRPSTTEASPNGNNVSIEEEMLNSVNATRDHSRALAVYQHSMNVLRLSIGRR